MSMKMNRVPFMNTQKFSFLVKDTFVNIRGSKLFIHHEVRIIFIKLLFCFCLLELFVTLRVLDFRLLQGLVNTTMSDVLSVCRTQLKHHLTIIKRILFMNYHSML